jgi:hypothetical protein
MVINKSAPMSTLSASGLVPDPALRGRRFSRRRWLNAGIWAATLALAGCGGGYVDGGVGIDVVVSGQVVEAWSAPVGSAQRVSLRVGQSLQLDAGEPVAWTMVAGGTAFPGTGTILYGGAYITQSVVGSRRLVVDTSAPYRLPTTVPVRFTAVSTYDGALVTVVDALIGN